LRHNDLIKAIRIQTPGTDSRWLELEHDQWAFTQELLQRIDKKVTLRIERAGQLQEVELMAEPDTTWPRADRGLYLASDIRIQQAGNPLEAIELGTYRTYRTIVETYLQLRAIITNRISHKALGGPIQIAKTAFESASVDIWEFIRILG